MENFFLECVNHSIAVPAFFFFLLVSSFVIYYDPNTEKNTNIQVSSPPLKFFTSVSRFCKLEINLASQANSFTKQIPPWRLADFLLLA